MLGDYSFCLAIFKVMQCRQTWGEGEGGIGTDAAAADYLQSSAGPLFTTAAPAHLLGKGDDDDDTRATTTTIAAAAATSTTNTNTNTTAAAITTTTTTTTDHMSSSSSRIKKNKLDAAFLVFIHALTKFSRYIICVRFGNGLRAVPSPEAFQNDKDMHIHSLLQDLSQRFGSSPPPPERSRSRSRSPERSLLEGQYQYQYQYPCFAKYQDDMISDIATRWGGFSRELAYQVFVVRGVALDPGWYREVEQVYLMQVQRMALANQPLEQVMDIFWPRNECCWAALFEGRGPHTTTTNTTITTVPAAVASTAAAAASTNLASKVRTKELKAMLDYFATPTPPSPSPHESPPYLHTILDSLHTPIETHPERYMRVLHSAECIMEEEFPRMRRYLRKVTRSTEILGDYWKMLDRSERAKVLGMFE